MTAGPCVSLVKLELIITTKRNRPTSAVRGEASVGGWCRTVGSGVCSGRCLAPGGFGRRGGSAGIGVVWNGWPAGVGLGLRVGGGLGGFVRVGQGVTAHPAVVRCRPRTARRA